MRTCYLILLAIISGIGPATCQTATVNVGPSPAYDAGSAIASGELPACQSPYLTELQSGCRMASAENSAGDEALVSQPVFELSRCYVGPHMPASVLQVLEDDGVYKNLYYRKAAPGSVFPTGPLSSTRNVESQARGVDNPEGIYFAGGADELLGVSRQWLFLNRSRQAVSQSPSPRGS